MGASESGMKLQLVMSPVSPTWTDEAVFAVLTAQLILLVFGGYLGWRQLRAQFRPFVVVDLEIRTPFIQLVVANLGTTMARDVQFKFDPRLESTRDGRPRTTPIADVSLFRDGIPSFPPGKRLVLLFDDGRTRTEAQLPDQYKVQVSYRGDPFKRRIQDSITLDIGTYREWGAIRRKDVHEVAEEIKKLRETLAKSD
jgi:hypothetical protein